MEAYHGTRPHRSLSDITANSPFLRDFLRMKQERKSVNRTLGAILSESKPSKPTLLDIIIDDPMGGTSGGTIGSNRNMWRTFKDKFRFHRTGSDQNQESAHQVSSYDSTTGELSNGPELNLIPSVIENTALMANPYEVEREEGESEESGERGDVPTRMSLMTLLAKTGQQMGLEGSPFVMDDKDLEEKEMNNNCCVCMVRRKGAAFIPCGHTFCRLCSRELWVQRGTCPICNKFILEILDIF